MWTVSLWSSSKRFSVEDSGATLVEYGVAVILAIVVGGGFLITLANQTDNAMDAGVTNLAVGDRTDDTGG